MKSFSAFTESALPSTGIFTPGNVNNGVMNHYIPIENIVISVRNIFAPWFGLVVEPGKDGYSINIYNSTFSSREAVDAAINFKPDGRTSLKDYLAMNGLPLYDVFPDGATYTVRFTAADMTDAAAPADESLGEIEMSVVTEDAGDETEMRDIITKTFYDVAKDAGKNGADKDWAASMGDGVKLPDGYYWANVKDADGNCSIALRKKTTKRLSFGRKSESTVSLLNVYGTGGKAIWVGCFDDKDTLSKEDEELIDNILSYIGAAPTKDPCVYSLDGPEAITEGLGRPGVYYAVVDQDGQILKAYVTEADAKADADAMTKENKIKYTVKKFKI